MILACVERRASSLRELVSSLSRTELLRLMLFTYHYDTAAPPAQRPHREAQAGDARPLPRLSDGTAHRCPGHTATVCMSALRPSTTCIATLSHAHTVTLVCIGLHLGGKSCGVTITTELRPLLPSAVLLHALAAGEGLTTRGKRGGSGGFPGKTAESQTCARCCCHCMLHTHSNSTHAAPVRLITPVLLQIEQQGPEKLQLLQQLQELQTKLAGGRGLGGTGISAENGRLGWAWCSSNVAILSSRGRSYQLLQSGQQKSKRPGRKRD